MMLHIPQVLDKTTIANLRQQLETSDAWVDGRETVGAQGAEVKQNLQLTDISPLKHELGQIILAALQRNPLFFAATLPAKILPPRFNRYANGGTYGYHIDGSIMSLQQGEQLRSDISCTLFINEPDEYEGGELSVSDTYGEHTVKLPAGDLILYPSSSLHCVTPVTKGARLAAFFWIQSLVRNENERRTLFELDTAITRLRDTNADRAAIVQLTGTYHNLLRKWAET